VREGNGRKKDHHQKSRHMVAVYEGPAETVGDESLLRRDKPEEVSVVSKPMRDADERNR
jgi:hypothetical protein